MKNPAHHTIGGAGPCLLTCPILYVLPDTVCVSAGVIAVCGGAIDRAVAYYF